VNSRKNWVFPVPEPPTRITMGARLIFVLVGLFVENQFQESVTSRVTCVPIKLLRRVALPPEFY